jgi:hypothetical protein
MINFSEVLVEKTETVIEQWVEAVRQDRQIESANDLASPSNRESSFPCPLGDGNCAFPYSRK